MFDVVGRILRPDGTLRGGVVVVDGARIASVEDRLVSDDAPIVSPGFVDLQVNGIGDVDASTADAADWVAAGRRLAAAGVVAWLPTLVSRPLDAYATPLASITAAMATPATGVVGAHLEGPFLGSRPGAHVRAAIVPIDRPWLAALPGAVRLVTMAPEQAEFAAATRSLTARGVAVSMGHSGADAATARAGADAGARMVTHLFNGMAPMHHRAPGLVGVALTDDRLAVGIIADGVHVDPVAVALAFRARPGAVVLVSDAVAWQSAHLAAADIRVVDGAPRLPDGTLAGSSLTLDQAVRNVVDAGVDPAAALAAASTTPAAVISHDTATGLRAGAPADLVVLDHDLCPQRTVRRGSTIWER